MTASTHQHNACPHQQQGMTLLELIITLAIVAVTASLALPALHTTLERNRIDTAKKTLVPAMALARNEAQKRGHPVTICASQDTTHCSGNVNDWSTGWLVVATTDEDGKSIDITDPEAILSVTQLQANLTLKASLDQIHFRSDGSTSQQARFTFCRQNTSSGGALAGSTNSIAVNYAGRLRRESLDESQFCRA